MKRAVIIICVLMTLLLVSCGSATLKEAQKAFDNGKYEQAIEIINKSDEKKEENEDLMALYIQSYEKWCEELISSGKPSDAITILNKNDEFQVNDGSKLAELYAEAWKVELETHIKDREYYYAYNDILEISNMKLLPEDVINEKAYEIGEGFADNKAFAPAALAYAKAGDYSDAKKKCWDSWDKGAFRNTAYVDDYTAVGIKKNGTVASAINTELIDSVENEEFRKARAKSKINTSGWKDIVSVKCNASYYVGLTHGGELKIGKTGYKEILIEEGLEKVSWENIVSFDMEEGTLVALNKDGDVLVTGDNRNEFAAVSEWKNIVQVSIDGGIITGVDIFGDVLVDNRYADDEEESDEDEEYTDDPEDIPFTQKELDDVNAAQFIANMYYGVYVSKSGNLWTTTNEDRASMTEFRTAAGNTVEMDLDDYSGFKEDDFVSCDASYDYYIGLRENGSVRVGGHMGYIMEDQMGVSKLKGLKEAHLGIGSNPVVYGVTGDGTFKMAGYEGGDYMPYHERIKAWGKLKKPTIVYDTSEFEK